MNLVADRFVVPGEGDAWDLVTGEAAHLVISRAGGITEQRRWAARCDLLARLRHPALAVLLDYGPLGESQRFEAWACRQSWQGADDAATAVLRAVRSFMSACGLSAVIDGDGVHDRDGRAVVVPGQDSGYACEAVPFAPSEEDLPGIALVERHEIAPVAEILAGEPAGRPRLAAVWGTPGSGVATVMRVMARMARMRGFVPASVFAVRDERVAHLIAGRSVAMVGAPPTRETWRALVDCTSRSPASHVVIFASIREVPDVPSVSLEPLSVETLMRAVRPESSRDADTSSIREAATRASGLPGRFVERLWRRPLQSSRPRLVGLPAVAEASATYGRMSSPEMTAATPAPRAWPAPREIAVLRRRAEDAAFAIGRGRHASGHRRLRAASAALARRGDWEHAARGALALAVAHLKRGRPRDAQRVLSEARNHALRARNDTTALDTAILLGAAWVDLGRLQDAERVLAAASEAARAGGEQAHVFGARLVLARCLFWQGRFDEAEHVLAALDPSRADVDSQVRLDIARARIAVGLRDPSRAVRLAGGALARARESGVASLIAAAGAASGFAHLAVGDADAVSRDVRTAVASARAAHDPLRALRARLLEAENARRRGKAGAAEALLRRLQRLTTPGLPPIVEARCALLADLIATPAMDGASVVKKHVATRGLPALALFAAIDGAAAPAADHTGIDDVLEVLQICQIAEDESRLLADVCRRLRARLRASSVAIVVPGASGLVPVTSDGGRADGVIAGRVIDARLTLPPHRHGAGIEGGAPIRYGGDVIGALVARWPMDADVNPQRASMVLTMAATAAAPAVALCLPRPNSRAAGDPLLGVSSAMRDVRRAIERAAHAPFAVLIEGESGSGKELVARAIHRSGPRRDRPWCAVNCAALPDDLIESELFGHSRGAFTGASADRAGVFEEAHTGTLFLDEVGELSPRAQAKLLRTIQEGEVRRVGENLARRIDVRLVSATNRNLPVEAAAGRFRIDLLYRLDVVRVALPPLRERRDDIPVLAEAFWRDAAGRVGSRATLGLSTLAALARYDWPGNVRELQNVLAALAVRSPRRGVIPPAALPPCFAVPVAEQASRLSEARRVFDERFIRAALARTGGHRARAATELGVTRQGLVKLMSRLGITCAEGESA